MSIRIACRKRRQLHDRVGVRWSHKRPTRTRTNTLSKDLRTRGSGRRVARRKDVGRGGGCWVPRNKSKGFRPVRFSLPLALGWARSLVRSYSRLFVFSTKEDNSDFRRTRRHLLCPRRTRPLAGQELLPQPQRTWALDTIPEVRLWL